MFSVVFFLGLSIMIKEEGTSLLFTYRILVSRSTAAPPHSPPPPKSGNIHPPSLLGGVYCSLYLIFLYLSISSRCVSGLRSLTSPGPKCWRAKGSGRVG